LGGGREEKQENNVYRLAINRIEIDSVLETNQHPKRLLQFRHPRMRNGDGTAGSGRSQSLTLQQRSANSVSGQIERGSGSSGQILDQGSLLSGNFVDGAGQVTGRE
jgi:hypothetical protein